MRWLAFDAPLRLPDGIPVTYVSRSTVSRRFIARTRAILADILRRALSQRYLVVFLNDPVLGKHQLVAAVGVSTRREKHVLGLWEGVTELPPLPAPLEQHFRGQTASQAARGKQSSPGTGISALPLLAGEEGGMAIARRPGAPMRGIFVLGSDACTRLAVAKGLVPFAEPVALRSPLESRRGSPAPQPPPPPRRSASPVRR